jgi:hypothetical protein
MPNKKQKLDCDIHIRLPYKEKKLLEKLAKWNFIKPGTLARQLLISALQKRRR